MSFCKGELLTLQEVALRLRRSVRTCRRLVDECQFRCIKIRGTLFIWESSIDDYLARESERWARENGYDENFSGKS